jgi:hypothetical protein
MLKLKENAKCSYCFKIFKDPILLPCVDSICNEHLSERNVVKEDKIKCNECKQEFQVKENEFKSNKGLNKLIENQSYLSEEEISLKQGLEGSIRKLFEFYKAFIQNKAKLESEVFDHLHEMRFQIDQHREELKNKIDEIAFEMIDNIMNFEKVYLKDLKERFSSFDQS